MEETMKRVLDEARATSLAELLANLKDLALSVPRPRKLDEVYTTINSDSIRLLLIEETLTDGSKVYNIELSEVCK
jgi:hypothetical protein